MRMLMWLPVVFSELRQKDDVATFTGHEPCGVDQAMAGVARFDNLASCRAVVVARAPAQDDRQRSMVSWLFNVHRRRRVGALLRRRGTFALSLKILATRGFAVGALQVTLVLTGSLIFLPTSFACMASVLPAYKRRGGLATMFGLPALVPFSTPVDRCLRMGSLPVGTKELVFF